MTAVKIDVDQASLRAMRERLGMMHSHMARHLATAVNRTSKSVAADAAKELGKIVNFSLHSTTKPFTSKRPTKASTLKKAVIAKQKATTDSTQAVIKLWGGSPFPIRWNSAHEYSKSRKGKRIRSGVRYKGKMGGGWTSVLEGFMVKQYGGNFYKREPEGGTRLRKIKSKAPGDYFKEANIPDKAKAKAAERLPIEIKRRLREVTLAASGKIKLRASPTLGDN
jgi:hypothetical protein